MKKSMLSVMTAVLFLFFGLTSVIAQEAEKPAGEASEKAEKAVPGEKKAKVAAVKPETISGTISMVDKDKKLLVLVSSQGVPYNFKVTSATRIKIGDKKAMIDQLAEQINKQVSVKFLPLLAGNAAQSIDVSQ